MDTNGLLLYYRPQRSWGKVIFSQACVILFTGGVHGRGGCLAWGVHGSGGVPGPGGMPGLGECLVLGGGAWSGGPGGDPPKMATAVGCMHPTGMHSC